MYKTLFILIILFLTFSNAAAQIKDDNFPPLNSAKQADYSESTPYKPREFENSKKKKESQKNPDEKKQAQPESKVSSGETNAGQIVRIPVLVYDRDGNEVKDLQNADFKVFVDDLEQEVASFETAKMPRNILLIVDTSPSLAYNDDNLKSLVSEMIKALGPDDKLQIIKFNQDLEVLNEPTNDLKVLQKSVKKIDIGDGTSLYEAIRTINKKYLASNTEQPVIILLTDGVDTTSRGANYISSLVDAEKNGAVVFPLYFDSSEVLPRIPPGFSVPLGGLSLPPSRRLPRPSLGGSNVGLTEVEYELGRTYLKDLAALSGGRTFTVKNLPQIKKEDFAAVLKSIDPQYYLSIKTAETANSFQRKQLKVRVNRPNLVVQARGSFVTGEN